MTVNRRLQHLLDTDELDWDDPRHREIYLREWVNKDGKAFRDDDGGDPCPSCDEADLEPRGGEYYCPQCGYQAPCRDLY